MLNLLKSRWESKVEELKAGQLGLNEGGAPGMSIRFSLAASGIFHPNVASHLPKRYFNPSYLHGLTTTLPLLEGATCSLQC